LRLIGAFSTARLWKLISADFTIRGYNEVLRNSPRRRLPGQLQPYVNPRGFPVVGFIENVHPPVTIEIGDTGLVKPYAGCENAFTEMTEAVAKKDPGCR
jgi:hypothetical protein